MRRLLGRVLPRGLKSKLRQSEFFKRKMAKRLASSSKRVDICSAQFAHAMHLAKHGTLEGKVCLEVGSGWVLSHAIVCHLLGAKKVIATDIVPCARPETIATALRKSVAYLPRDMLAPFSDHTRIRERYARLLRKSHFSFDVLQEFGIEYRAPVDFATQKVDTPVDFIYSNSVLEHVPKHDVKALLENLVESLNEGGTMIHRIHLEDHQDMASQPFGFLSIPDDQFGRDEQTARGNRIRGSTWRELFADLEGVDTEVIYSYARGEKELPTTIDPSIAYLDEDDLRTTHIGMYSKKGG